MPVLAKKKKTRAMRMLEQAKVPYDVIEFEPSDEGAAGVAAFADLPLDHVYKTLVVLKDDANAKPMLIMIGADRELNLKLVAQSIGVKKVQMAKHAEAEALTGLKVGGISAITLRNHSFDIFIDQRVMALEKVAVSAGERGFDVHLAVDDLLEITNAALIEAT